MENANNYSSQDEDTINLRAIYRTLGRSKITLISGTLIFTFFVALYSVFAKPTWRGSFEIAAIDDSTNMRLSGLSGANPSSLLNFALSGDNEINSPKKTQITIMKSSVILNRVFEYHKEYLESKSISTKKLAFKDWIKTIAIDYEKGTNIIKIAYENKDKEHILNILNLLKERFEIYSLQNRTEQLDKLEKYLSSQVKLLRIQSKESLQELNKFSIKHGLGNIDGFLDLGNNVRSFSESNLKKFVDQGKLSNDILQNSPTNFSNQTESNAGQRYENLRILYEQYETLYFDLQSKLKPSSQTLISLKNKIENLKIRLKRPNEILLKYRELTSKAKRDESSLFDMENKLGALKLEKAREDSPWKIINNPVLDLEPVSPNIKLNLFAAFILSLILLSAYLILKEKNSERIFEIDDLINKINIKFRLSIAKENFRKDPKLINNLIRSDIKELDLDNSQSQLINLVCVPKNLNKEIISIDNYNIVSLENMDLLENSDYIIFIIKEGEIFNQDIELINNYYQIYKEKIFGWIYIN